MIKQLVGAAALLSLVGCGTGPSEGDIDAAIQKLVKEQNKQMDAIGAMVGGAHSNMMDDMKAEAPKVKKVGCKEDGESAFRCDVEITKKQGTNVAPLRFVKGSDGWVVAR